MSKAETPITERQWTWLGGSNLVIDPPVYGQKGVPNSANIPLSRHGAAGCYDKTKQEYWLFGGGGEAVGTYSLLFSHFS